MLRTCLKSWTRSAEIEQLRPETEQDGVDRRGDCPAVTAGQNQICQGSNDANLGFGPDFVEGCIEGGRSSVVNDLGVLHGVAGGHVQAGHIPPHVGITNNRDETRHFCSLDLDGNCGKGKDQLLSSS